MPTTIQQYLDNARACPSTVAPLDSCVSVATLRAAHPDLLRALRKVSGARSEPAGQTSADMLCRAQRHDRYMVEARSMLSVHPVEVVTLGDLLELYSGDMPESIAARERMTQAEMDDLYAQIEALEAVVEVAS